MKTQMQFLNNEATLKFACEALVLVLPTEAPSWGGESVAELYATGEFSGKTMEMALIHHPRGWAAKRLLVIGSGEKAPDALAVWRMAGAAARYLKARKVRQMTFAVTRKMEPAAAVKAWITGVESGNFDPDVYKSDRKPEQQISELTLLLLDTVERGAVEQAAREAAVMAAGQRFARELANEPGNRMTPTILGERAQAMARQAGLDCELIDAKRAQELKMGSFLAVGQGSVEPPVMIVLRYKGAEGGPTLGIIGKGITFDSGGISIKPAANMDQMKFDMSGGAATLGAMQAIAALKPKINIVAIVAAAENMPGGRAQKPGDVQTAMSGKTIEVLNTDAEGRMVLADALHYARQLGATHLIDSATLTGACVVALGNVNAGVFASDEEFYAKFEAARRRTGEKMWRLP
ncbi:MAG TPA: leucyl aminopeptidase, partial [Terriglobales bacterium]|nr:leucyl aminopeptidase [Terriglobales bacterium]